MRRSSPLFDGVDEKRSGTTMGSVSKGNILPAEAEVMRGTNPTVPRPKALVYYVDRCFKGCSRGRVDARPR